MFGFNNRVDMVNLATKRDSSAEVSSVSPSSERINYSLISSDER